MKNRCFVTGARDARPLVLLRPDAAQHWIRDAGAPQRRWLHEAGFNGSLGEFVLSPGGDGGATATMVVAGDGTAFDLWRLASLPLRLPAATWKLDGADVALAQRAALAWGLGSYQFARYRQPEREPATLVLPSGIDADAVQRTVAADALARDLINTPAQDLLPSALARVAQQLARRLKMTARIVRGDALLKHGYRLVHAVGRAADDAPLLIDLAWGDRANPRVTLVGKGVCFDSGGLDIKAADGMKLMKKDMGGAAHVLALAQMIVLAQLPVRLRVLVPAVENAISGNAFRPLDVIKSKKGLTVEIGNTDAEGRLILADALFEACEDQPQLLIDMATLTGAARVALGPDLPALFCNDDPLADELARHSAAQADPLWRLPLWRPYRARLASAVADLNNVADGPMAGALNAAVFLQDFVTPTVPWIHLDIYGWNPWPQHGRPIGAQTQCLRALFALIESRFGDRPPVRRRR